MNAPERSEFLARRMAGIGGSDIAAVMGLSPWKTPVQLWLEKTGQAADTGDTERMYWGTVLEEVAAREYAKRSGNKVERVNRQLSHPQYPWALANLDRIVWQGGRMPVDRKTGALRSRHLLECKTADAWAAAEWDESPDSAPLQYLAQVMWYMGVTGADRCDIAVLIGGNTYLQRTIERDEETIRAMLAAADEFWNCYVIPQVAPAPLNGADVQLLFKVDSGASIVADVDLQDLIDQARAADMAAKAADATAESLKDQIKVRMRDASGVVSPSGQMLCTWKSTKPRQTFDVDALREELPDIAARFTQIGKSVRPFKFK